MPGSEAYLSHDGERLEYRQAQHQPVNGVHRVPLAPTQQHSPGNRNAGKEGEHYLHVMAAAEAATTTPKGAAAAGQAGAKAMFSRRLNLQHVCAS